MHSCRADKARNATQFDKHPPIQCYSLAASEQATMLNASIFVGFVGLTSLRMGMHIVCSGRHHAKVNTVTLR
jgi:hypothetical protein